MNDTILSFAIFGYDILVVLTILTPIFIMWLVDNHKENKRVKLAMQKIRLRRQLRRIESM